MKPETLYRHVTGEVRRQCEGESAAVLVDVRTPAEYARHHIPGVLLIPIDEFAGRVGELRQEDEIICLCEHGVRSEMAAQYLSALGYPRVATMTGGMAEYSGPVESEGGMGNIATGFLFPVICATAQTPGIMSAPSRPAHPPSQHFEQVFMDHARIAPPEPYKAIIFDCDGTLADTMPTHVKAWVASYKSFGIDIAEEPVL